MPIGTDFQGRSIVNLKSSFRVLMLLAVAASGGCEQAKNAEVVMDKQADQTRQSLGDITKQGISERFNPLVVTDKVWAGDVALRIQRGIPLPPKFETPHGITIVSAEPMTLAEIGSAINAQTGLPVHVADVSAGSSTGGAGAAAAGGPTFAAGVARPVSVAGGSGSSGPTMPVAYEGTLSGFLERVAGNFGVSWKYDGNVISISRFETRIFTVEAMPGSQKTSVDMQGGTTSGGSGSSAGGTVGAASSSSTMQTKTDIDIKYWDELKDVLTSLIGGTGSMVLSPSLGTLTVTTTPEIMQTVASYITEQNYRMSRQIAINVQVYNIILDKNEDYNIAFSSFIRKLGNFGPITLSGSSAPTSVGGLTGLSSATVQILNQGSGHDSITDVFNALSSIQNSTKIAEFPMVTLNNRPVSVRIGQDISYIAQSQSSTTTSAVTTTPTVTLTPDTIKEGFSVQVAPRLLDDGRILVLYSLTSVDLDNFILYNSVCGVGVSTANNSVSQGNNFPGCQLQAGSTTVQLPTTTNHSFSQQSVLRSGTTLLIGGINQKNIGQNSQGTGDPYNYLLGGGTSSNVTNSMVLIAITPQVMDVPRAEHG